MQALCLIAKYKMPNKKSKRNKRLRERIKRAKTKQHEKNRQVKLIRNIRRYGTKITRRQFDAYCYCRMPLVRFTAEELEWYWLFEGKLLAVLIKDVQDGDYGYVILGRDSRKLFRAIDLCKDFYDRPQKARTALAEHLFRYENDVQSIYSQGDEAENVLELFKPLIESDKQHHNYKYLDSEWRFEAAKNLITEIANSFIDNDGNYAKDFQSNNFNSRLWELYLHIYFHNAGLLVENNHAAPDFEVIDFGKKYFVEAVTANKSDNPNRPDLPPPKSNEEVRDQLNDFMPIKFGSPLYSKLQKKYWLKEHVKEHPFILAIHDYHNENAMTWSRTALSEYLYGVRVYVVNGKNVTEKISEHEWKDKKIPSGFFSLPEAEYVSAVLFGNQATIPKFNRMGKLAGLGSQEVKMFRHGFLYNPEPGATDPIPFTADVDDPDYEESWSDGLVMFHNPNAKYPLDPNSFTDISHIWYSDEDGYYGFHQPYDVLGSITISIIPEKDAAEHNNLFQRSAKNRAR